MQFILNEPWYLVLLCLLAGIAAGMLLYFRNKRTAEAPRGILVTLFVLRSATVFLAAVLLAGILLRQVINESRPPTVILAVDNSASMVSGRDSSFVRTRLSGELENLRSSIGENYRVDLVYFGEASRNGGSATFSEKETDIEALFRDVGNNYANENIGAMLLVSDGIYNRGANPVYSADKLGFPVHTLMTGDTAEKTDLRVSRVSHNQVVYLNNVFPVEVALGAKRFRGEKVKVEITQGGQVRAAKEVTVGSAAYAASLTFTLSASAPGVVRYAARVVSARKEDNTANNSQDFVIEVIDNKDKIMLLAAAPHPDLGALREAITASGSYQLETYLKESPAGLRGFNLAIFHGTPPRQEQLIEQCRAEGIPYWIINPSNENVPGIRISNSMGRFNEAEAFVDPSFGFFSLSEELRAFVNDLPALRVFFGNYEVPPGSAPLLRQRLGAVQTEQPILYFTPEIQSRGAVLLGEGFWRWKMRDFVANGNTKLFTELVSKTIQYLAVRSDKSYFRVHAPRVVSENENLEIDAELYDKSFEPLNAPDVFITLRNEEGKKFNYTFSKTARAYRLNAGRLPAGEYSWKANVKHGAENYVKEGLVVVRETFAEKLNTVADHQLLQQISARSGGRSFTVQQFRELAEVLGSPANLRTVLYSQTLTRPLIDQKIIFVFILVFAATEWFLRKRYLLI